MNLIKVLFIICIFNIAVTSINPLDSSPVNKQTIETEIEKIISRETRKAKRLDYTNSLFNHISEIISETFRDKAVLLKRAAFAVLIIMALALLIFIINTIVRMAISRNMKQRNHRIILDNNDDTPGLNQIARLEAENRLSEAVILSYKLSIELLHNAKITFSKNQTNRTLLGLIKNDDLKKDFKVIFTNAELVAFDNYIPDSTGYNRFREYFRNFIQNRALLETNK